MELFTFIFVNHSKSEAFVNQILRINIERKVINWYCFLEMNTATQM